MTHDLFGDIRSLLQRPMSPHVWVQLTMLLDAVDDPDVLEQSITPYLLAHFARAHAEVERLPPEHWYDDDLSDARRRAYSKLICIACPECKTLCDQSEVTRALKARFGKDYTRTVRTRDLMTAQRQDVPWECTRCMDRVSCPTCARTLSFAEVIEAMASTHGPGERARQLARSVLDQQPVRSWGCVACQADPTVGVSPARVSDASRSHVMDQGPYHDIQSRCKTCSASFVFTAEEQFVWYRRYGIPEGVEGMWGHVDRIVKARCDTCQRSHIAQKRIGQILQDLRDDDPAQHRALMHHYTTLGNEEKANRHRNSLNKLEEASLEPPT